VNATDGLTRLLDNTSLANSPNPNRAAQAGTVAIDGRRNCSARACVNFSFVTGFGATAFTGPDNDSCSTKNTTRRTTSKSDIQLKYCLPFPSLPPNPKRKGVAITFNAPPRGPSTTPRRGVTTRHDGAAT